MYELWSDIKPHYPEVATFESIFDMYFFNRFTWVKLVFNLFEPKYQISKKRYFYYICSLCNRVLFFSQSNLKFENKYKFFALEIDMYMYMFPNMYDVLWRSPWSMVGVWTIVWTDGYIWDLGISGTWVYLGPGYIWRTIANHYLTNYLSNSLEKCIILSFHLLTHLQKLILSLNILYQIYPTLILSKWNPNLL